MVRALIKDAYVITVVILLREGWGIVSRMGKLYL
jgi:hypothetical protein